MIDSHTHSKYSKHAIGSIEEIVLSAIKNDIQFLTITDHAPFPIDIDNRLLNDELKYYFDDINYVQSKYSKDITILLISSTFLSILEGVNLEIIQVFPTNIPFPIFRKLLFRAHCRNCC